MTLEELIADLACAFPRQEIKRGTFDVYVRELADVPAPVLEQAVQEIIRTHEFFPTVRTVREVAAERILRLPSETDALAQIDSRITWTRDGEAGDVPEVHPVVREALELCGGFHRFRTGDQASIAQGQFQKVYRERRAHALRAAVLTTMTTPAQVTP